MNGKRVEKNILSIADTLREKAKGLATDAENSSLSEIIIYATINTGEYQPELSIEHKYRINNSVSNND